MTLPRAQRLLVLVLIAAASAANALAATCPVTCTGPGPHDVPLAAALACAGPGGTVEVSGACRLDAALALNLPGQTLRGDCTASLSRILPAPPPGFDTPSAALVIGAGASGATIRDLTLAGAGNGISTSPSSATVPAGQPDDVTILRCRIQAGLEYDGAAIQHFGQNGPPFNDVDSCTGDPAGIATGWVIEGNDLSSERGSGIRLGGSGFRITGNHVRASLHGIAAENPTRTAAVLPFGAPPANRDNYYADNVIDVTGNAWLAPGDVTTGLVDIGFTDAPVGPPAGDRCDRGYNTRWERNCVTLTPDGAAGRDFVVAAAIGGNGNAVGSVVLERNRFDARRPLAGEPSGNVGVQTSGSKFARVDRNLFSGTGDLPFNSFQAEAEGNQYLRNRIGPAFTADPHFVHDFGVEHSNCYDKNHYCDAHEEYEGDGADPDCGVNFPGTTCNGVRVRCPRPPRAPACASSASSNGLTRGDFAADDEGAAVPQPRRAAPAGIARRRPSAAQSHRVHLGALPSYP